MAVDGIQAVVRLIRKDIIVEERAFFPDTANVNVLLQRLGADAHRRFKPQMLMAKESEERELQERTRQEELARFQQEESAGLTHTPAPVASEPPTIQAVQRMSEASELFQHVNAHLDRLAFAMQQMNSRLYAIERKNEQTSDLDSIMVEGRGPHVRP
jgi:hypothetical protein